MLIRTVFLTIFSSLLASVYYGVPLAYPLFFGLLCFSFITLRRGHSLVALGEMVNAGIKKSRIVLQIFVLIGIITAVWRACGTVSFIVYYGILLMDPHYFLLSSFILCSIVSFLLGTSFGTVGTIGVALMVLAKSGEVNLAMTAGVIISGAFFGDRCSPMSSSAWLVATLTETDLYKNVVNMAKTTVIPLILSVLFYGYLSLGNPLVVQDTPIPGEILAAFDIGIITVLPAALILLLAFFRVNVKISMLLSILTGLGIALFVQHETVSDMVRYMLTGYTREGEGLFVSIIGGGGLYSMISPALIVLISSAYAGIFAGTGMVAELESAIVKVSKKAGIYPSMILTSLGTAAFSCNQTMAVIMTHQFHQKMYDQAKLDNYRLAIDLENTVIIMSPLIPWNIAGAFPAAMLSADAGFIGYAFYLYMLPLIYGMTVAGKAGRLKAVS